ncbi:GIY-YIG nuclease family protein [Polymorphobacter sp. PAMC 29334]|uniref:GIY-YIG nuclease family protein n=1 Tax=Polymorphobacter sp. PAMC 29334 TaxID=2862331 RepID=UPI001C796F9E|nr:GIY-YIG nuclease family protein [Polymorphobacter sp. PAMC 29334]QYE35141.1 GIY-YIG nuclease family protein [Polymorphobacter sp. PAMC 29334]
MRATDKLKKLSAVNGNPAGAVLTPCNSRNAVLLAAMANITPSFIDSPLTLNSLLIASGIALEEVLVLRHRPSEASLNRVFNWIAEERPDLFDCYQSTHGPRVEAALNRAKFVASFIRHEAGTALFVGLCRVAGTRTIGRDECILRPAHIELIQLGMSGVFASSARKHVVEFDLAQTPWNEKWHGRLIIKWPGLERSWYRWADRNVFPIQAIAQENLLRAPVPPWDRITLDWSELAVLPESWRAVLSQWRGIYLIIDRSDGRQYVGSAYGVANILQRWLEYARTGHGGNSQLRQRAPANFSFSILQRVSPDLDAEKVIEIEGTWKRRLRSLSPSGLNDN